MPVSQQKSNITPLRQTYQIKITLEGIRPPIWRRLLVDSRIPLEELHEAIQCSMGWYDQHLHHFIDKDHNIYQSSLNDTFSSNYNYLNESVVLLHELLKKEKDWLKYQYDFGDSWDHKVILEKILPMAKNHLPVRCIKGKRACPPEDCGGVWGYQNMLKVVADPTHEEYEDIINWLEDEILDPEFFDLAATNELLREYFEDVVFTQKAGLSEEQERIKSYGITERQPANELASDFMLDPSAEPDLKQLVEGMQETVEMINQMSDMLDEALQALIEISELSKEEKIKSIARRMINKLDL